MRRVHSSSTSSSFLFALATLALTGVTGAGQEAPSFGSSSPEPGRIIGKILDAESARPLAAVQVSLEDGSAGALTDIDGRYVLSRVPAGSHTVVVQRVGYGTKRITGVEVAGGSVVPLDVTIEEQAVEVEGITVSAVREMGSTAALLDQRRTASALVDAVGSAEIGRRPDSDAADVARRMTGVTVSDGRYVFVRGLGGRYSQTTLDGSSLPSPEPEKEVVPLDLFPSGFLESLEAQKSYTPDLPADFSGGMVKINTTDFPGRFTVKLGVGTSVNTASQFKDQFLSYPGGGTGFLGLQGDRRRIPDPIVDLVGGIKGDRLPSDEQTLIQIGQALKASNVPFTPVTGSTPLNRSFDLSVGGRTPLFDDGELGYFVAGTYANRHTVRTDEIERKWRSSAFDPDIDPSLRSPNVDYTFQRGTQNVAWGTIGNLTFKPTPSHKLSLRTTVSVDTDDEARTYVGENEEDIGGSVRADRIRFVRRMMLWGQLSGEHGTFLGSRIHWRLTGARADRDEPFMREAIYLEDRGEFRLVNIGESGRYFWSDLTDDDLSGEVDWRVPFGLFGNEAAVKVGAAWRERERDFGARRLNWRFLGNTLTNIDAALDTAAIVPTARKPGEFSIADVVEPGDLYDARDARRAAYVMFDLPLTSKLQAIVGARVESYSLELASRGESLRDADQTDVAPSFNLVYSLSDEVKVRGAASRTVDRPEFRELAPFQFTEATSLRQLYGNPELTSADITSGDLRVDWFPGPGEMVSLGGFYKAIDNPVEQVFIAAASTAYSFQNAGDAEVLGLEADVQLGLHRLSGALRDFRTQVNYAWIDSNVRVRDGVGGYQPTNLERPLEGQASYVLNAGLSWVGRPGWEAGLFLNRFGRRLEAAGGSGLPDIYEQPRNALDATVGFGLPRGVRVRIKGSNLLDEPFRFEQSANGITLLQRQYAVGSTFSVGLSWEF